MLNENQLKSMHYCQFNMLLVCCRFV